MSHNNLQYKNVIKKLEILSDTLFSKLNIDHELDSELSMNWAETDIDDTTGHASKVIIGIDELQEKHGLFLSRYVSNQKFAQVVVNVYHEYAHCLQKNSVFQKKNASSNEVNQALSDLACRDNTRYYKDNGNYFINPNEIQAEYYGITNAYDYLCESFPDVDPEQHEQTLLGIVNEKSENYSYWIHHPKDKPFESLCDVKNAFNEAYSNSFSAKRIYSVKSSFNKDSAKQYMDENASARDAYLRQIVGMKQDKIIAVINCKIRPGFKTQYKCLDSVDLSYEKNIEHLYCLNNDERMEMAFTDNIKGISTDLYLNK